MDLRQRHAPPASRCIVFGVALLAALAMAAAEYPDPERYREAIGAFLAAESETPPPKGAVVATGSSSMRGWHRRIAQDLAPLTVIPRGFGGSNMADVVHFVDDLVLRHQPRAVLLYEGDNDAAVGAQPEDILAHFDAFVDAIHDRQPEVRIYVLAVKPSIARWHLQDVMSATNQGFEERAATDPRIAFIDIATPMLNEDGKPKEDIFVADGLHMNAAGYDIWRDVVRAVLVAAEAGFENG